MIDENSVTPYENKVRRNLLTTAGRRIFIEAGDGLGSSILVLLYQVKSL